MKPEDQTSQTEAGTAEEEQVKPETEESADKAKSKPTKSSEAKPTKSLKSKRRSSSTASEAKPSRSKSSSRSTVAHISGARFGFIGAGRMTESIVKGLLKTEKVKPKQIFVAAKTTKNLDTFKVQGIATSTRSYDIFGKFDCDVIFMAVHGSVVRNCFKLSGTRPMALTTNFIPSRKRPIYILSLIGGVSLDDLKSTLLNPEPEKRYKVTLHRLVLNNSVAYGWGLGALDVDVDSKKCAPVIRDTLQAIAKMEHVPVDLMDAFCSLVGNGSAFVYFYIAALADGGFKMGLSKRVATKLAIETMQCAAQTMLETGKGPAELRNEATSPSGAAIYGIHVLDKQDCATAIENAINAAYNRIKELAAP